ncbi:MAG: PD40 domain-containing protein [Trueperaceae bacterium]|nr:PD40 domain-containing protein [Trueperaceae bacterium]
MKVFLLAFVLMTVAYAQEEMSSEHFRLIYPSPSDSAYASRILAEAEEALAVLEPLFGAPAEPIILKLEDSTDSYNAFATLLPRPNIQLRSLFPLDNSLGFGAKSELYFLLIHELTHITQLAYTGSEPLRLGLPSDGNAAFPPPWFTEGIAVYIETNYTEGGRATDARTLGLLYSKALADDLPSLAEISLSSYSEWPSGAARYLYGGHFVGFLADRYGFEAILQLLRAYNSSLLPLSFSQAWQQATGHRLEKDWSEWQAALKAEALEQTYTEIDLISEAGSFVASPSVSPDGKRLAWVSGSSLMIATLNRDGLENPEVVQRRVRPQKILWLDDQALVYNRSYRQPETSLNELFSFDLMSQSETRLSTGARAFFPVKGQGECILYVKDRVEKSSVLMQFCNGEATELWQSPADSHIVGLATSSMGQIALSIWQAGWVDIAILKEGKLQYLTRDVYQDIDPTWDGEEALLFSSDRGEGYEVFRLLLEDGSLTELSQTLAGAFTPVATEQGIFFLAQTKDGYQLALLDRSQEQVVNYSLEPAELYEENQETFPSKGYLPFASLAPYGWYPSYATYDLTALNLGLGISVSGQDDSARHSYSLNLGYDTALSGPLAGLIGNLEYGFQDNVDAVRLKTFPFGIQVKTGLFRHVPHLLGRPENALGIETQLRLTQPLDKWSVYGLGRLGLVYLNSFGDWQLEGLGNAILSQRSEDTWGYVSEGMRFGLTGIWSATATGPSAGLWGDGSYYMPLRSMGLELDGTFEALTRFGYRQAPPVPLALGDWALSSSLGYRYSYPLEWRYDDGLLAVERLTFEPRLRGWYDGAFGLGADLTLSADTVLSYNAPISFSASIGYSQLFWYRFGLDIHLN